MIDPAIFAALTLAVRLAEKEYDAKRDYHSAQLVSDMRKALGCVEVYAEREGGR